MSDSLSPDPSGNIGYEFLKWRIKRYQPLAYHRFVEHGLGPNLIEERLPDLPKACEKCDGIGEICNPNMSPEAMDDLVTCSDCGGTGIHGLSQTSDV